MENNDSELEALEIKCAVLQLRNERLTRKLAEAEERMDEMSMPNGRWINRVLYEEMKDRAESAEQLAIASEKHAAGAPEVVLELRLRAERLQKEKDFAVDANRQYLERAERAEEMVSRLKQMVDRNARSEEVKQQIKKAADFATGLERSRCMRIAVDHGVMHSDPHWKAACREIGQTIYRATSQEQPSEASEKASGD